MSANIESRILSKDVSLHEREEALVGHVTMKQREVLPLLRRLLKEDNPYMRSRAALCLGMIKGREVYQDILGAMRDSEEYVRCDAVIALGESQDSRSLFALSNYYQHVGYEEKKRVLIAMKILADPRAVDFLEGVINSRDSSEVILRGMACEARDVSLDRHQSIFVYRYHGSDSNVSDAEKVTGRINLISADNLERSRKIFAELSTFEPPRPQSYIIDVNGNLFIGGYIMEHVDVAQGQDVLAAGEIDFEYSGGIWRVSYVNNRSNGYFPHGSSFKFLQAALNEEDTGIKFDFSDFSEKFPKLRYSDPDFLFNHPFYSGLR